MACASEDVADFRTILWRHETVDAQEAIKFSVTGEKTDHRDSTQEGSQKTPQKILELVKEDAYITTQRMADLIGVDRSNVARAIKKLQLQGILRRVGPDKGGYWEIISTDQQPTDEREMTERKGNYSIE